MNEVILSTGTDDVQESSSLFLDNIPPEMRGLRRWCNWKYGEPRPNGKRPKQPITPAGAFASVTNPKTFSTFDDAVTAWRENSDRINGVGYCFTASDGYVGVDLDRSYDAEAGSLVQWAEGVVLSLNSYSEVSPSGMGVHVICCGEKPAGSCRRGDIEMYHEGRFFVMTGCHLPGTPATIERRQEALERVHAQFLGVKKVEAETSVILPTVTLADQEILRRANGARNGEKFRRLWSGDVSGYHSHSEADMALCRLLAFWVGPDAGRIDALVRQSHLFRPKWIERRGQTTYGLVTIDKVLGTYAGPCYSGLQYHSTEHLSPTPYPRTPYPHTGTPTTLLIHSNTDTTLCKSHVSHFPTEQGGERFKTDSVFNNQPPCKSSVETFSTDKGEYGREEIEAAIAETVPASEGSWKKLSWLLEHAKRDVPPNLDIGNAQPEFLLLASFCREAQRRSRLGSFFLSCRTAGQLLGVPYQTAARWLKRLQTLGVLKLCERGTRATGNASRFRYLGELAAVEPATVGQVVA